VRPCFSAVRFCARPSLPSFSARAARAAGVSRPARRLPGDAAETIERLLARPGSAFACTPDTRAGRRSSSRRSSSETAVCAAGERGPAVPQGHRRPVERASRGGARRARRSRKSMRRCSVSLPMSKSSAACCSSRRPRSRRGVVSVAGRRDPCLVAHPAFRDLEYRRRC